MPPLIATVVYLTGIAGLFWLDPELRGRATAAFWVPLAWFLINGSRPVATWFSRQALSPDQLLEGSPLDRTVFLALQIAGLFLLYQRRHTLMRVLRANTPLLFFVLYCAVSVSWSEYPEVAFKRWIKLLGDITMVLLVISAPDRARTFKRIVITCAFVLVPVSILLDKYYPELSRYYDRYTGVPFISGVGTDKNMLGMTCLIYGLAVLWQLLVAWREKKGRPRTRRLIAYGIVLLMVVYLFRSADSMTSLSCFVMGGFLLVVVSLFRWARRPAMVHLLVACIVGATFAVLFLHVDEGSALQSLGRNATLTGRTQIWAGVLKFAGNPWIGTGFESFWLGSRMLRVWAYGQLTYGINEAHNGYLETYLNLGWIGVALLAGLIVTGYRNILKALRVEPDTARLRLAFFTVALVYSFTEVGFRITCTVWLAFLLAILAVPAPVSLKRGRARPLSESEAREPDESRARVTA